MTSGIGVDAHKQVVLILSYFNRCIQIATLEITIKKQLVTSFDCRIHSFEQANTVFRFEIGMEFSEVCSHVSEIIRYDCFVLKAVLVIHLLLKLETTGIPVAFVI